MQHIRQSIVNYSRQARIADQHLISAASGGVSFIGCLNIRFQRAANLRKVGGKVTSDLHSLLAIVVRNRSESFRKDQLNRDLLIQSLQRKL